MFRKPKQRKDNQRQTLASNHSEDVASSTASDENQIKDGRHDDEDEVFEQKPKAQKSVLTFDEEEDEESLIPQQNLFAGNARRSNLHSKHKVKKKSKSALIHSTISSSTRQDTRSDEEVRGGQKIKMEIKEEIMEVVVSDDEGNNKNGTNANFSTTTTKTSFADIKRQYESVPDEDIQNPFSSADIPDAKAVFEARKRRELMRKKDDGIEPAIPLINNAETVIEDKHAAKSRLIREDDENDMSDDENAGHFNNTTMESAWQNEDENEGGGGYFSSEDEMETWEREQIRKAIGHRKVTALKEEVTAIRRHYHGPDADQDRLVDEDMDIEIVEQPSSGPTTAASVEAKLRRPRRYLNMAQLLEKLEMSVISRHEEIKTKEYQLEQYAKNIEENNESISKMTESNLLLERSFQLYQEMKFYIDTVLNCLNEKILIINEIETEIFDLWKARADDLSRRRAEEENRSRFERYSTKDAWNSDEEEKAQPDSYVEAMNRLIERAGAIFEDTATEYCDFGTLIRRLIDWFQTNPRSFRDAYVAECIPKLVGPFVRIELFLWNPLNSNCAKLSSFNWYRSILGLGFNNEGIDVDDPAISGLIPDIVEKVVLPKLTKIVNELWDPLSISQTQRLTELIDQFVSTYPSINRDSKFFKKLLAAMQQKAQTSLQLKREIPGHLTSLVTEIQQKPVEKPPASQGESYDDIQALFAQSRSVMK